MPLTSTVSLRSRVTILAATVVLVSVSLMAAAAYFTVHRAMYNDIDKQLESRADGLTAMSRVGMLEQGPEMALQGTVFSTSITVLLESESGLILRIGDVPMGLPEFAVMNAPESAGVVQSLRTVGGRRALARGRERRLRDADPERRLLRAVLPRQPVRPVVEHPDVAVRAGHPGAGSDHRVAWTESRAWWPMPGTNSRRR